MYVYTHLCVWTHIYTYADINIHLIYTDAYVHTHTHTRAHQTLHFPSFISLSQTLRCYELYMFCSNKTTGLSWLCAERAQPHTAIITDICGQDTEVHLSHTRLLEKVHSHTCFNGVSSACGFSLIDVGVTASCSLRVKGSGLCSK